MKPKKHPKWKLVDEEEIRALEKNETWEVTTLPKNKKQCVASELLPSNTKLMAA